MEQVINCVGEGYNLSTAIVGTLDSTTITQLLSPARLGRFLVRRGASKLETKNRDPGNRGLMRPADA